MPSNGCQQNDFRCAACPPTRELPSFSTFKEACEHSFNVHRVTLITAVQSSTLLPDNLVMYLCKLCTPDHRKNFLCETSVKNHLETHSAFFLKRWKEFTEIKCRICEDVIEVTELEEHVDKFHPIHMFADINDIENNDFKCFPKSPATQYPFLSPDKRKSHSLPNNLSPVTKMRSWQSSQPASVGDLLWDSCFQPEQLISKYYSKLAPAALRQEEPPTTVETVPLPTKPLIRVKPLRLLQAQAKQVLEGGDQEPPSRQAKQIPSKKHSRSSPSSSYVQRSPSMPSRRSHSQKKSMSRSPLPTNSEPSKKRELPPAKTWWSKQNQPYHVPTGTCLLCGLEVPRNRLAMHNIYNHQDMMFRCKVGTCRTSRRSCYLYANKLNNHHQDYHNQNKYNHLNTTESMTGLPASMVKISCSKCSYFVLFPDTRPVLNHLRSVHRVENHPVSLLRYHCRVCEKPFSSVEKVVEHSKDHLADRSQSWMDSEFDQGSTGYTSWRRRSSGRNIFRSPSRMSMRSSNRTSRSPSRKSKISPSRKSRRSSSWNSRRSLSRKSRRSPSRKSRRSSSRLRSTSPSRISRRSPSRISRRSPSRINKRSPSRKRKRSTRRTSRRSPNRKSKISPSRKRRTSPCSKSRGSPSDSRSGSPPGNTSQFYKYRARGWNGSEEGYCNNY